MNNEETIAEVLLKLKRPLQEIQTQTEILEKKQSLKNAIKWHQRKQEELTQKRELFALITTVLAAIIFSSWVRSNNFDQALRHLDLFKLFQADLIGSLALIGLPISATLWVRNRFQQVDHEIDKDFLVDEYLEIDDF